MIGSLLSAAMNETTSQLVRFLDRVCGDTLQDAASIARDRLQFFRWNQALRLRDKAEEVLRRRGVAAPRQVPPKFALPLLEAASIEDDDQLHTLWASLLSNAMDPSFDGQLRSSYIDILRQLEPLEVRVLMSLHQQSLVAITDGNETLFSKQKIAQAMEIEGRRAETALLNLMRLGLVKPGLVPGSMKYGDFRVDAYMGTELVHLSGLGRQLVQAVSQSPTTRGFEREK